MVLLKISTLFSEDAFTLMLKLASSMTLIPYPLVASYALLISRRGETYDAAGLAQAPHPLCDGC